MAGGIPILRALRESFAGDRVASVSGILNGTCNFILTEMEATGRAYADVLKDAQRLGYAEADPASDVEGEDAAYKLALLARLAFGRDAQVAQIAREGITRLLPCDFVYAKRLGRTPRQLGVARELPSGHLLLSVRTHLVSQASLLAKVTGPFNAIEVKAAAGGSFVFSGRGAGGDPTATAVLADVVELARSKGEPRVPPLGFADLLTCEAASAREFVSAYSLRFVVRDRSGIIADLARILADNGANIEAVFQEPWDDKDALPVRHHARAGRAERARRRAREDRRARLPRRAPARAAADRLGPVERRRRAALVLPREERGPEADAHHREDEEAELAEDEEPRTWSRSCAGSSAAPSDVNSGLHGEPDREPDDREEDRGRPAAARGAASRPGTRRARSRPRRARARRARGRT